MSKRLQVLLDESEFRELRRAARTRGVSVAELVRAALRSSLREIPRGDPDRKLAAVRTASQHAFPTADIERMLSEIATGQERLPE
jgi:hypothetical protein